MSTSPLPSLFAPGSPEYERATAPRNASATQRPALVAVPESIDELAATVSYCVDHALTAVPQATGHGAAGTIDAGCLLVDTSQMSVVRIDSSGVATAGAGAQWGTVDRAAWTSRRLGLAGSAPDVGISGFTFGGGAGWLTRPHGLASGSLIAVDYVNGAGHTRRASDDAEDPVDREAMYAFRGGGGVGLAAGLTFQLVRVEHLRAGFLLWPVEHLDAVVTAWAEAMDSIGPDLNTSLGVLTAPESPLVPGSLHGSRVVHLAVVSTTGAPDDEPLWRALVAAPPPAANTWGPADVERLGTIHLDPPVAVPAIGMARWLDASTPTIAGDVLRTAADSPLEMVELRNVANDARVREGAVTRPLGAFMLHAVGGTDDPQARDAGLARVRKAAAPADTGLSIGSWVDGSGSVPDALPEAVWARVAAARASVDPEGVIAASRFLA